MSALTDDVMAPLTPRPRFTGRWSIRQLVRWAIVAAVAVSVSAIGVGAYAIGRLNDARYQVVNRLDPASADVLRLTNAMIDQENGVRGYVLSARDTFLAPYTRGRVDESTAIAALRADLDTRYPRIVADLDAVTAAAGAWQTGYAEPAIAQVTASSKPLPAANLDEGKLLFDRVRTAIDTMNESIDHAQVLAHRQLSQAASLLASVAIAIAAGIILGALALAVGLARGALRPLGRLTGHVRDVADGNFDHPIRAGGPREIEQLGDDVESMRLRILAELSTLREVHAALNVQARALQRANNDLEQFAYVASNDLQDPLRTVVEYGELLRAQYGATLDERAREYIGFAIDGATRMQTLINGLLAYAQIGRAGRSPIAFDGDQILRAAEANLAAKIEQTGATITADQLPTLHGDPALLTTALQNLLDNAITFRRPDTAPVVTLTVRLDGDKWLFTCTDNGIGIAAGDADRIFVIFRRLDAASAVPGVGIGLAICRKIIEYHGGAIWLDISRPTGEPGSRFCFTLPVAAARESDLDP